MVRQRLTREESRERTRERLLQAARQAIARHGYGGASVDDMAKEAGYSKGAFYSNFDSKEAIFIELLRLHMAREIEEVSAILEAGEGGEAGDAGETGDADPEAVMVAMDGWLDTLNEDADWSLLAMELQLYARRNKTFAKRYYALQHEHRDALGQIIAKLFAKAGKAPPVAPEEIASALMALAHGLVLQRQQTRGRDPAGPLIKLVLRSILAAAPPA